MIYVAIVWGSLIFVVRVDAETRASERTSALCYHRLKYIEMTWNDLSGITGSLLLQWTHPFWQASTIMTELQIEPSRPWYSLGYCTGSRIHITCTSPKWGMQGQNEDAKTFLYPKRISEGLLSALALGKTWIHLATDTRITKDNVQKWKTPCRF